jgi:hypothetical protein
MEDNQLTPQVKLALLQREMAEWQQLQYTLEVRHRVNKRVGAPPEALRNVSRGLRQLP